MSSVTTVGDIRHSAAGRSRDAVYFETLHRAEIMLWLELPVTELDVRLRSLGGLLSGTLLVVILGGALFGLAVQSSSVEHSPPGNTSQSRVTELWRTQLRYVDTWSDRPILVTSDTVYTIAHQVILPPNPDDPGLVAFDAASGKMRWAIARAGSPSGGLPWIHPLAATSDVLYVLDRRGQPAQPGTSLPTLGLSALAAGTGVTRWTHTAAITSVRAAVMLDLTRDRIYIECWSGGNAGVCSIDPTTGTERWRHKLPPDTNASEYRFGVVGIVAAEWSVFVAYGDGSLYSLDAESGMEQWRRPLDSKGAGSIGSQQIAHLAIAGDTVYAITTGTPSSQVQGDSLIAINSDTGAVRWSFRAPAVAAPCAQWPIVVTVAENLETVFVSDLAGTLYALDARSGEQRWHFAPLQNPNAACPQPFSNPFGIYLSEAEPLYKPVEVGGVVAFSPVAPANALRDGRITGILSEHMLYGVDAATGKERWRVQLPGTLVGTPVIQGRTLVISTRFDGSVIGLDAETGGEIWRVSQVGETVGEPGVWEDRVYVTTQSVRQVFLGYAYEDVAVVAIQVQPVR